jgi:hypothetical protein
LVWLASAVGSPHGTHAQSSSSLDINQNGVLDVLLIGNSQFGFVPDPPMTARALGQLATAQGLPMLVDLAQVGGVGCEGYWTYRNADHWMEPQPRAAQGNYDIVFLQPAISESVYTTHSGDFSCWDNFRNLVEGRGRRFALFGTLDVQSAFVSGTDNMDLINLQYARAHGLMYVPAGRILRSIVGSAPTPAQLNVFYENDHMHPSSEAQYVYVLSFFRALSQRPVTGITYQAPALGLGTTRDASGAICSVTATEALLYQQVVDQVLGGGTATAGSGGGAGSAAQGGAAGQTAGGLGGSGGAGQGGTVAQAGSGGSAGSSGMAGGAGSAGAAAGSGGSGGTVRVLTSGVPVTGLSDSVVGHQVLYTFLAPAEATSVTVVMTAGTGDADLYVRRGAAPTLSAWDCRPYEGVSVSETCQLTNSAATTYYIMLDAYKAYAGVSLLATFTTPSSSGNTPELANGATVSGISGSRGSQKYWRMSNVPAGRTLTIAISGFTGDPDLYVRAGALPTLNSYACRPYLGAGKAETCKISVGTTGTYYIMLYGHRDYSNAKLSGSY